MAIKVSEISLVSMNTQRFDKMKGLAETFLLHPMTKEKDGVILPMSLEDVEHALKSEEGRMQSKNGAQVKDKSRGGSYSLKLSLAKGDYSPLWRLYWLAGEIIEAEAEILGLEKTGKRFSRLAAPVKV